METNRIFGIDFYRATAILMVLLANTIYFFQLQIPAFSALAPIIGYLGLEIFFVLSGFLLGRSFYPIFMADNFGFLPLLHFLKRKLLRILPLYFLIILVNIGIAANMNYPYFFVWKYFLLVQNFSTTIPPFFPESWGLPVIVFAILLFSVFLFGISKLINQKQKSVAFPAVAFGLILVFIWTKWLFHTQHPETNMTQWEAEMKTVTIFRPDSVFIGILFSWLFREGHALLKQSKVLFAGLGLLGVGFLCVGVGYLQLLIETHPIFWTIFYLLLTSFILACFLPILVEWHSVSKFFGRPVTFISRISYSIYLTHFSLVLLSMEHFLFNDFSEGTNLILLALAYLVVAIFSGFLLYWMVEKRLQRLIANLERF